MKHTRILIVIVALIASIFALPAAAQLPDPLAGTAWELVSINGDSVVEGSTVTLSFGTDGRAFGSGGCNNYGTSYSFNEDRIFFSQAVSTMMACMEEGLMEQELAFQLALSTAETFTQTSEQLTITLADGGELVFAPLFTLTGTNWQVFTLGGEETVAAITLSFGDNGEATGSGGCNTFSAPYIDNAGDLRFGPAVSTMMACVDESANAQELAFFQALEAASSYAIVDGQLVISYGDGEQMVLNAVSVLAGTRWQLVSLDGADVVENTTVTLEFAEGGEVRGETGCNGYSTRYTESGSALSFNPEIISTMMACVDEAANAQEQAWLSALSTATAFTLADDVLTITYGDGAEMVLTPLG